MPNLIYGKIFQSMFTGSMCGAGAHVFAVMSYVVSFMQPGEDREEYVRLQVPYLCKVIGEDAETIQEAIEYLKGKDEQSYSPGEDGRRLVEVSPFYYRVVNGRYYRELKDEEDRKRKDAERARRYRDRKKGRNSGKPLPGEAAYVRGVENGTLDKDGQPVPVSAQASQSGAGETVGGSDAVFAADHPLRIVRPD